MELNYDVFYGVIHGEDEGITDISLYRNREKIGTPENPEIKRMRIETDFLSRCGIAGIMSLFAIVTVERTNGKKGEVSMHYFPERSFDRLDKCLRGLKTDGYFLMELSPGNYTIV